METSINKTLSSPPAFKPPNVTSLPRFGAWCVQGTTVPVLYCFIVFINLTVCDRKRDLNMLPNYIYCCIQLLRRFNIYVLLNGILVTTSIQSYHISRFYTVAMARLTTLFYCIFTGNKVLLDLCSITSQTRIFKCFITTW